jgi:hypothetical protein
LGTKTYFFSGKNFKVGREDEEDDEREEEEEDDDGFDIRFG